MIKELMTIASRTNEDDGDNEQNIQPHSALTFQFHERTSINFREENITDTDTAPFSFSFLEHSYSNDLSRGCQRQRQLFTRLERRESRL